MCFVLLLFFLYSCSLKSPLYYIHSSIARQQSQTVKSTIEQRAYCSLIPHELEHIFQTDWQTLQNDCSIMFNEHYVGNIQLNRLLIIKSRYIIVVMHHLSYWPYWESGTNLTPDKWLIYQTVWRWLIFASKY